MPDDDTIAPKREPPPLSRSRRSVFSTHLYADRYKTCPICQHSISKDHEEALSLDKDSK